MFRGILVIAVSFIGFNVTSPVFSADEPDESENRGCFTGPAVKTFGYTTWNVYSCADPDSLAIVSTPGSPAMPFYFMIFKKDGKRRLVGEGTGDKEATSAAANDLRQLIESEAAIGALIAETIAADWRIPAEDIVAAENLVKGFRGALDNEAYTDAYDMLTAGMRRMVPLEEWASLNRQTKLQIGELLKNSEDKITWYDHPANAQEPGIYAAFDIVCNYERTAYCTEVLILHKFDGGEFHVMRHEINFMDKKTYQQLQQQK